MYMCMYTLTPTFNATFVAKTKSQTHALPENIRQIVTLRFINDLKSTFFLNVVIMFEKKNCPWKKYMMKMLNNNSNNGRTWLTDWPA